MTSTGARQAFFRFLNLVGSLRTMGPYPAGRRECLVAPHSRGDQDPEKDSHDNQVREDGMPVHQSGIPRLTVPKGIYKSLATIVKMEVRFEPTFCIVATAAIEIKTAIRAYSIAVAPSSLLNSSINT